MFVSSVELKFQAELEIEKWLVWHSSSDRSRFSVEAAFEFKLESLLLLLLQHLPDVAVCGWRGVKIQEIFIYICSWYALKSRRVTMKPNWLGLLQVKYISQVFKKIIIFIWSWTTACVTNGENVLIDEHWRWNQSALFRHDNAFIVGCASICSVLSYG